VNLLSALALCGACEAKIGVGIAGVPGKYRWIYQCKAEGCRKIARDRDKTDHRVENAVIGRLNMDDARDLITARDVVDLDGLRSEAAALHDRKGIIARQVGRGLMNEADSMEALEEIQERLTEIDRLTINASAAELLKPLIEAGDIRAEWEGYPLSRKRAVIERLMIIHIDTAPRGRTWHPEFIRISWRDPH
jgi:hypothetical protein